MHKGADDIALAPPLHVAQWLNTDDPPDLVTLRGKVVVVVAFQLLCPGCVSQGLPQASRIHQAFGAGDLQVLGLHSVFEHHDAQGPATLAAFLHENRIRFPVAVDAPAERGPIPRTMQAYDLQGTPSLILIGRDGTLRNVQFGHAPDLVLGAEIAKLLLERRSGAQT